MAHPIRFVARLALAACMFSFAACGGDSTPMGTGDAGTPCEAFCTQDLQVCSGTEAQFASAAECLTACAAWAAGTAGETSGNSLACRQTHLDLAAGSAASALIHCPHTADVSAVCQ